MSLNRKLILLVVVAVGVVVAGWFLVARALAADARDEAHADLRRAARSQTTLVERQVGLLEGRFADISARVNASPDPEMTPAMLDELRDSIRDVEAIAVVFPTGRTTTTSNGFDPLEPTRVVPQDRVAVTATPTSGREQELAELEATDRTADAVALPPLTETEEPWVVLGGPVAPGRLLVRFSADLVGPDDRTPLFDSEEVLLVATNDDDTITVLDRSPINGPVIDIPDTATDRPSVQAVMVDDLVILETDDYRGVATMAAVTPIEGTDWGLVIKIDESDIGSAPGTLIRWVSIAVLGVVTAVVIVGGLFLRSIAKRLADITRVTQSLGAGDLGATIDDPGNDELTALADTIDQLSTDLRNDRARRELAEAALAHQARHDPLTGLPNRGAFMGELEAAIERDPDGTWAVLFCDLDGFKAVNDGMGHNAGDILLERTADRLREAVDDDVILARFGGDEFMFLCPTGPDGQGPRRLARAVEQALSEPIEVGSGRVDLSASIGIAAHEPNDTADLLVRNADMAMYRVKEQRKAAGLNRAPTSETIYGPVSHDDELRRAIEQGNQLRLLYQPIVDLTSGQITGVEALVRWHHPGLGLLNPKGFLPQADASGLLGELDFWVLERSCDQLSAWEHAGRLPDEFVMSVNLSPAQLSNPELGQHIADCLRHHDVDPWLLQIEITEHSLVTDDVRVTNALTDLKDLGVGLAIDDFGTLYANLDRIRDLPADVLKIDQSFVANLTDSPDDRAIIDAIVKMAEALELKLVAEGIERQGQALILRDLGCRYGQGFYFGNPRSPEATAHLLTHGVVGISVDVRDEPGADGQQPTATVNAPL